MDQFRQIRFLIPPFFLLLSTTLGIYYHLKSVSPEPIKVMLDFFKDKSTVEILAVFVTAGVGSIALGFFVGTVSIIFLTLIVKLFQIILFILSRLPIIRRFQKLTEWHALFQGTTYEAIISNDTFSRMLRRFQFRDLNEIRVSDFLRWKLYVVATFDHHFLIQQSTGVHEWILRRWNAFNVSLHSVFAMILPPFVAYVLEIPSIWVEWKIWIWSITIPLLINGSIAWWQTMKMIDFQSRIAPQQTIEN